MHVLTCTVNVLQLRILCFFCQTASLKYVLTRYLHLILLACGTNKLCKHTICSNLCIIRIVCNVLYLFQQDNLTGLCNLGNTLEELKTREVLLNEQPIQHTFNNLLPDIDYTVSVAAINNVGNGYPNITVQTTAEEGTCVICFEVMESFHFCH